MKMSKAKNWSGFSLSASSFEKAARQTPISATSGVPMVAPWPVGKVITEADLGLPSEGAIAERYKRYHDALIGHVFKDRPEMVTAVVRKGDILVWTSLSPHLTMPAKHFPAKRLSLQVLVRPSHLRHGTFCHQPDEFHTSRMIRVSDRIGYSVSEDIAKTYGIDGDSI